MIESSSAHAAAAAQILIAIVPIVVLSLLFIFIEGLGYALLGGLIPFALGISLVAFYFVTRPDSKRVEPAT